MAQPGYQGNNHEQWHGYKQPKPRCGRQCGFHDGSPCSSLVSAAVVAITGLSAPITKRPGHASHASPHWLHANRMATADFAYMNALSRVSCYFYGDSWLNRLKDPSLFRTIDKIDRKILRELQLNGRLTNAELSRRVNLSPTPCLERVRRLERDGFIRGYRAELAPRSSRLRCDLLHRGRTGSHHA